MAGKPIRHLLGDGGIRAPGTPLFCFRKWPKHFSRNACDATWRTATRGERLARGSKGPCGRRCSGVAASTALPSLDVPELATKVGASRSLVCRTVRAVLGASPFPLTLPPLGPRLAIQLAARLAADDSEDHPPCRIDVGTNRKPHSIARSSASSVCRRRSIGAACGRCTADAFGWRSHNEANGPDRITNSYRIILRQETE